MFGLRFHSRISLAAVLVTAAGFAISGTSGQNIRSDFAGSGKHQSKLITGSFYPDLVAEDAVRALEQSHCREMNRKPGDQIKSFEVSAFGSDGWYSYSATCR
ncbi:hypothetical protein SAMN04488523_106268 [Sulfitobacter brevis]|uniref:Uncharacterized protein n=1 Tax=Sulfitobacter brevis TaxID=74348 RepID=A0A1I1ZW27_9RHOB|nr:hypothetical protein [Sulfitobacter brevis]SFE35836.1 hypothetical protein SAMN04488523_106268 [Sulfitobacter brevis]